MSYSKCACGQGNKCQWLGSGLDISKSAHRCSYMYTDILRYDHRVSGLCLQEEEKTFVCCHCKELIKKAESNPDDSDEDFVFSNATIKTTILTTRFISNVLHVALWHNSNSGPLIHFPWWDNSCAENSITSAWWIIYQKCLQQSDYLHTFRADFPSIINIFDNLQDQSIDNIVAREFLHDIMQIDREDFKNQEFVTTDLISEYMKSNLCNEIDVMTGHPSSITFSWTYNVSWLCVHCNQRFDDKKSHTNHDVTLLERHTKDNVQLSLDTNLLESIRPIYCKRCQKKTVVVRETTKFPNILQLTFPSADGNGYIPLPIHLDKEVTVEGVKFDIIGSTYGCGTHFFFRYIHDGKIYEADGMRRHSTSTDFRTVRAAESVEIKEPYEKALAGHINWISNRQNIKIGGQKICDVFYLKRF